MPRTTRVDFPGAWHHVVNRGLAKRTVFENRADMRRFLAGLARAVRRGEIELHSYCLMTTHFHLLVSSPRGLLSTAMRRVEQSYVRRFNRQRRRDGSLFRGRFFSRPVHSDADRRIVVRYIDHNPVAARVVDVPTEYEFGSASRFASDSVPPWLAMGWMRDVLAGAAFAGRSRAETYLDAFGEIGADHRHLVHRRMEHRPRESDPLDDLLAAAPEAVRQWMMRKARLADGSRPGLPLLGPRSAMLACADDQARRGPWSVVVRSRSRDASRLAQVYLLRDGCGFSFAEIANQQGISPATASRCFDAHLAAMKEDHDYAARLATLAQDAFRRCHQR